MILGLGSDIVSMVRIQQAIEKFGSRFERRVFAKSERELAWKRGSPCIRTYTGRWASKEALLKALGTGLIKGISFKDIIVENLSSGKPVLLVKGEAAKEEFAPYACPNRNRSYDPAKIEYAFASKFFAIFYL